MAEAEWCLGMRGSEVELRNDWTCIVAVKKEVKL